MKQKKIIIILKSGKKIVVKCNDYKVEKANGEMTLDLRGTRKVFSLLNDVSVIYEKL